jgi:STE24 endopeptidase
LRNTPWLKAAVAAEFLLVLTLFLLTTFLESPQRRARAEQYFTETEIENGLNYSLQGRLLFWGSTVMPLAAFTLIVVSGFARKLADLFERWTGKRWLWTLLLMGLFCFLVEVSLIFPFQLGNLARQHAWGMSQRSLTSWLMDYLKLTALSGGISLFVLVGFYLLMRFFPCSWWALAALASGLLAILFAFVLPTLIAPLFNDFTPLDRTQWAYVKPRVEALTRKADVPVEEVLVMDASRQSSHSNAYFTGFGSTRRIVLYDTLLKSHPRSDEVESIVAHEIGHWKHHHIVKGIALGTAAAFVALFLLAKVLRWATGRAPFGLREPSDPAGLPLILLLAMLGSFVLAPIQNAISREFERQADEYSLDLAGQPKAFIRAEKTLALHNHGNVAPNSVSVWLFASHPPTIDRIRMAEEWAEAHQTGEKAGEKGTQLLCRKPGLLEPKSGISLTANSGFQQVFWQESLGFCILAANPSRCEIIRDAPPACIGRSTRSATARGTAPNNSGPRHCCSGDV